MRRIILFRHAKSAWGDPGISDHDRPLNPRGRLAATLMGAFLADQDLRPDVVLLSSSARTAETWDRAKRAFDATPASEASEVLYHADPAAMLDLLKRQPGSARTVLIVGHNPGLASLARKLSDASVRPSCARAFDKFPTGAIAVFEADIDDWSALDFDSCSFAQFAIPKDLV